MFITIEGGEGAGKSSNLGFIHDTLVSDGYDVVMTREPGGTGLGEAIRGLLLDRKQAAMCVDSELLLVFAARAQHLAEVIWPALSQGKVVLCDRFTDATYAYQGAGRGLAHERIAELERIVQQGFQPDLTILLDVPVQIGMARVGERGNPDRFEQENIEFFERIRNKYLSMSREHSARYRVIDAALPLEMVQNQLRSVLKTYLGRAS